MISYMRKSSPFHTWDAYSRRLVGWGAKVRQLGGCHSPWPFYRGCNDSITPTDWLQMSIHWIMAGGRTCFATSSGGLPSTMTSHLRTPFGRRTRKAVIGNIEGRREKANVGNLPSGVRDRKDADGVLAGMVVQRG